jgi:hypothetical protein
LGTATDREVARRLGRKAAAVQRKRWESKIPAFDPATVRTEWTTWERVQLGRDTDAAVAGRIGRTVAEVKSERERLGIPACRDHRRK